MSAAPARNVVPWQFGEHDRITIDNVQYLDPVPTTHGWALRRASNPNLTETFPEATSDTLALVKAATHGVRKTWRDGYRYSKAGVVTTDLMPLAASQRAMPGLGQLDREMGAALMEALDACNRRFGRGTVVPGAAGFAPKREWSTKFEMRSPRYTTRLDELPVIAAA